MPRPPRLDYPGARHHVMNRGARREPVFFDDNYCAEFLSLVAVLPERFGIRVHAYALMPNHFHLLLESMRGRLSDGMQYVGSHFVQWFNSHRKAWDGPVFKGRFHSKEVIYEEHWHHLLAYLHLNPVRANLVKNINRSRWTSHGGYAGKENVPEWLTIDDLLQGYGSQSGYIEYVRDMRFGRIEPPDDFNSVLFSPYTRRKSSKKENLSRHPKLPAVRTVKKIVSEVCSVSVKSLSTSRCGRKGNWPRKLAAYWLVIGSGQKNIEVAKVLNMHPVRVSQALREVSKRRRNDDQFRETFNKIEEIINR
ncbi:MAG: hypothetical protein GY847_06670 [Proteobacteria bacterium]|nr:hypothetical protein [Pseudomonadota bacterium]